MSEPQVYNGDKQMSVLVLDFVVWMGGVSCHCECMLLYLAKKLRSIVGHKECAVEGSIVRQEPCEVEEGDQWQALSH